MAPTAPSPEPMSAEQAATLSEFARACKSAARAVSLYPATHPAIQGALSRIVKESSRLASTGEVTITVLPEALAIEGRAPTKPDPAIGELADLLHARLVGALTVEREADGADWHAFLRLLGRAPEELVQQEGGIAKAWAATGRTHFDIREIDYAEVLREREGGEIAGWDSIIANCLQGDKLDLDERALNTLLELTGDPEKFGAFLDRLQQAGGETTKVGARAAALLRIIRGLLDLVSKQRPEHKDELLGNIAKATSKLTPEMMMAMIQQGRSAEGGEHGDIVSSVVERMTDDTIATFVAGSVVKEHGATGRLAQAFQSLVPEAERKHRLLELAHDEVAEAPLGAEGGFEDLWQGAANMLTQYSDEPFVSDEYARELSGARTQAVEVERVSDDPPERVEAWLASVSDKAVRQLDRQLLFDLLKIEPDAGQWRSVADVVVSEIERLTQHGAVMEAQHLLDALLRETTPEGREPLKKAATSAIEKLAGGPLVKHLVVHLRKIEEKEVVPFAHLCHAMGPVVIRPLAEALAVEEHNKAFRRLREILLGFGAAGRQSAERLKHSANPAVRRTAIDLLRVFGGREALPELASMLDDADPQVQRDSIRAIVQIGTEEAYAVLEHALVGGGASRDTIVQQLIDLRDDKAIPLLCYVVSHTRPRGHLINVHLGIIDALGMLGAHPQSTRTLKDVLYRGEWWAPYRTAALRGAAAASLRRIGAPETIAVLEEAAARGSRGVRHAARAQAGLGRPAPAREKIEQ